MRSGRTEASALLALAVVLWAGAAGIQASSTGSVVTGCIETTGSRNQNSPVNAAGVALWLVPSDGAPVPGLPGPTRVRLEQQNKRFIPHVRVIQVGTEVDFPNNDPFFHNVFSLFDGKIFDLGLYANGESRPVRFDRPGVSFIYCNIHPQMSAVIVTVETPYFGVSESDGTFAVRNVPPGSYRLHVWNERSDSEQLASKSRVVRVAAPLVNLGTIRLDESHYIPRTHKNKHGEDYDTNRRAPGYPPP